MYLFMIIFCANFSFWDIIDFVLYIHSGRLLLGWEIFANLNGTLADIFANLIQTLISQVRVLNPKACGVQGRNPGGGCEGPNPPPKIMFSMNCLIFQVHFLINFVYKINHKSRNKNRQIVFSFVWAHFFFFNFFFHFWRFFFVGY